MKYLKKFENHTAYEAYIASGYVRPNVSYCVQESDVHYNPMTMADKYLTFTALEDTTFKLTIGSAVSESILSSISYSTDNGKTWNTTNNVDSETVTITTPTIHEGDKVLWKGSGTGVSTTINNSNRPSTSSIFSSSGSFNAEGNIMSLIYGDDFSDKDSVEGTYNFALMFYSYNLSDTAKIVSAKDMVFPIKSVPTCCYFRMFQGCTLVEAPSVIDVESVGTSGCTSMFWGCTNLKTTPKLQATTLGVESCRAMFDGCTGLETVTEIPTAISVDATSYDSMFNQCTGLTSVTIGSGVTSIGNNTFYSCSGLTSVTIPDSVTSIGQQAFRNCSGLTSVEIGSGVTSIGNNAFEYCTSLSSVTIPNSVTSIGEYTFCLCKSLTSATINCQNTGKHTFEQCSGLTSVSIGSSVTNIGDFTFSGCTSLSSVTIPNSVTSIGINTFYDCHSLTSIDIPNSVTTIGDYAFSRCSGLTSVLIPDSVTSIGNSPFSYNSLTSITVDSNNVAYDSRNNCNAIIETSTNKLIQGCKNTVIPNTVTEIHDSSFNHCSGLISITIPDSVTYISSYAFDYCTSLTSITIPDSVTYISSYAFRGCKLSSATIGSGVTSIGQSAFYNCRSLTSITCNVTTAPTIQANTFRDVKTGGTLYVPQGSSGYDTWMGTGSYYLGKYSWTKVEQ